MWPNAKKKNIKDLQNNFIKNTRRYKYISIHIYYIYIFLNIRKFAYERMHTQLRIKMMMGVISRRPYFQCDTTTWRHTHLKILVRREINESFRKMKCHEEGGTLEKVADTGQSITLLEDK